MVSYIAAQSLHGFLLHPQPLNKVGAGINWEELVSIWYVYWMNGIFILPVPVNNTLSVTRPCRVDRRHLEEGKQPAQGTSNVLARVSEVKMSPVADWLSKCTSSPIPTHSLTVREVATHPCWLAKCNSAELQNINCWGCRLHWSFHIM